MRRVAAQTSTPRWGIPVGVVVLAIVAVLIIRAATDGEAPANPGRPPEPEAPAGPRVHVATPVVANRTADVPDGFRGDVHPMLHGRAPLEVTAHWTGLEPGQVKLQDHPAEVRAWFTALRPAVPRMAYTARDFSAFLPAGKADVGQVWALDADKVRTFLAQFHPHPLMHLVATGRRAGPDGAFAVLRAVSPSHVEIVFRLHAEFYVTPDAAGDLRSVYAWFTPAYFHGRLVLDKTRGTVEYFRLAVPTEKALNAFLTVNPSLLDVPVLGHDIVRVDRMELTGGDARLADGRIWTESLPPAEAARKLAKVFYKFEEIDWVPVEQAAAKARGQNRPIFAIVSWGATDDQSC